MSSKSVARDVLPNLISIDKKQEYWTWVPLSYEDKIICIKEEAKYPLIAPLEPLNTCNDKNWSKVNYSLVSEN